MITLLEFNGKIIITVPVGSPVLHGDIQSNGMPMLRRYTYNRISMIETIVKNEGLSINSSFYFSNNFEDWYETDIEISKEKYYTAINPFTPNSIWAFNVTKS
jgi:hypothetical protein